MEGGSATTTVSKGRHSTCTATAMPGLERRGFLVVPQMKGLGNVGLGFAVVSSLALALAFAVRGAFEPQRRL